MQQPRQSPDRNCASARDFGWIITAYTVALAAASLLLVQDWIALPDSVLLRALAADVLATLVIFGFSQWFGNASFYDAYWSVAPPFLALYFLMAFAAELDTRALLIFALVLAWAVRLTHNWARGWHGLGHEDWRYVDLAATTGRFWWLVNLLGIHLFPTVLVFLGCLSIAACFAGPAAPLNALDALASLIGWAALWLEFTADNQLRDFRTTPGNAGTTLATGVWSWCRHPNYLGEIGFWLALFAYAFAATGTQSFELAIWGPVAMIALFMGISIPMIDKRLATREGFAEHKARTFALLPVSHWRARSR